MFDNSDSPRRGRAPIRLVFALLIGLGSVVTYCTTREVNPITGEPQYVGMRKDQEIALGLQAAPEIAAEFGGLHPDAQARDRMAQIGRSLVAKSVAARSDYPFEFHLLADRQTVNAFALPGGQIFMTAALYERLENDTQVAAVLGHEVGHVIERHGAQQLAKAQLTQGLSGAAVIATYDPNDPNSRGSAAVAALVGQMINLRYGRGDELEADQWGVRLLHEAGLDPRAMIRVMEILADAGGPDRPPEFFSTHPNPENRIARIREAIEKIEAGGSER